MHQINAPKLLLSLKSSIAEKKHVAMQKLFIKKKEMNKIAHVFLQKKIQISNKRDMFQEA